MAKAEWGIGVRGKWWSYKRVIVIACSLNVVVALYFLSTLFSSLSSYSDTVSRNVVKYTPDQISKMAESIRIRRASEPVELIELVKELNMELFKADIVELPRSLKRKVIDDILQRFREFNGTSSLREQRDAVESWRKQKLTEIKNINDGINLSTSSFSLEEAGILLKVLESDWEDLLESIGLWIPNEVIHKEHDDKPEGEPDFDEDIIPGRPLPPECRTEIHTDYGGMAVRWGLTHHKDSAADCCEACLDQAKNAKPDAMRCNIWVYCPSETGCYSPDIYEHKYQECWLKFAETPRVSFKGQYSESYREAHPTAPLIVPWVSGVIAA
uniref:Uncharacterized protein n=1 Tax=Kalanchoe fedtschenkoi TaxID=63787 RepID=A0A7N0V5Z4_KALFE